MKIKPQKDYILVSSPSMVYIFGILSGMPKLAKAAAFFPFIFVRSEEVIEPWLINHERIHFQQQLETLFLGLFILEWIETFYALIVLKKSFKQAYQWRSSEQEAYRNQLDKNYLVHRKRWSLFCYIKNKKEFSFGNHGEIIVIQNESQNSSFQ